MFDNKTNLTTNGLHGTDKIPRTYLFVIGNTSSSPLSIFDIKPQKKTLFESIRILFGIIYIMIISYIYMFPKHQSDVRSVTVWCLNVLLYILIVWVFSFVCDDSFLNFSLLLRFILCFIYFFFLFIMT